MVQDSDRPRCAQAGHSAFLPAFARPFPPPALENVPLPYILDQLHNLAVNYWDKPHTADCTVIAPIVPQRRIARNSTDCSSNVCQSPLQQGPVDLGRRNTEPTAPVTRPTRMTSKLHLDYLLAQSSLFRDLFSGRPLSEGSERGRPDTPTTPSPYPCTALPAHRLPHIMPSTPAHPIILLPLPDPSSFPHLVHFMYFGTFDALENALDQGNVQWADVVRNVEYLGMRSRVKAFLGRWYAQRIGPTAPPVVCGEDVDKFLAYGSDMDDEESSSDEDEDDSDDSDIYSDSDSDSDDSISDTDGSLETIADDEPIGITAFSRKMNIDVPMMDVDTDDEPPRGRSRTRNSPRATTFSPVRRHRS